MTDLSDANPYPEDEPELQEAWEEGFRAGKNDETVPQDRIYDDDERELAWIEGYMKGQQSL